jgi:hypothetical protein
VNEPNGHAVIDMVEDNYSSVRPACGPSRWENDYGSNQKGRHFPTQQKPENAREVGIKVRLPVCHEEADWHVQACAAQSNGRLPVRDEVPGCSCEVPFLRRIAYGGTLDLRRIAVTVYDAGPVTGQPVEPNGVALDP